jgi:Transglycosylase-like domain
MNRPHTLWRQARSDDAFLLSDRGAYAMAGARLHRAEPGVKSRPTKGGAVRIRIALTTAMAVLVIPALLFALFTGSTSASARVRHTAGTRHRTTRVDMRLMSYAQAEKAAKLADYYNAVIAAEEQNYLRGISYVETVAAQQAAAAAAQQAAAQQAAAAAAATRARVAAAPAPSPAPAPVPAPAGTATDATSTNTQDWACIRTHESGDNYSEGGGGAYQFALGTWEGLTGLGTPAEDSPPAVQDAAALKLYAQRGWEPWTTRYVCGL